MPANTNDAAEGGQNVEWSETLHSWLFRAQIFLKRYWWIYLLTISGGIAWQAYIEWNRVPTYVSSAELIVDVQVFGGTLAGPRAVENMADFYATNIKLMRSSAVMNVARENVANDTQYPQYQKATPPASFDVRRMSGGAAGFEMSVTGPDPRYNKLLLEQIIASFLDTKREMVEDAIEKQSVVNLSQVEKYTNLVQDIENQRREFLTKRSIPSIQAGKQVADAEDARLSAQVVNLERQITRLDDATLAAYVEGRDVEDMDRFVADSSLVAVDPAYPQNKAALLTERRTEALFAHVWTDAHERMIALKARINRLEDALKVQRQLIALDLQNRRGELARQLAIATTERDLARQNAIDFGAIESQYAAIESALDRANKTLDQLLATTTGLDLSKVSQDMFKELEPPSAGALIGVDKVKQIGTGAFVGFVLGTVLIFLLGVLDGRVMSVEDVTQRFEEPMLGIIPMQRRIAGEVELLKANDQRLMFAESCRNLRSSLLYMDRQGQRPRTVVLTSSIPAEGKSTISANLAITLGFAASRTLLVDADLRRGVLHKRFGLKNELGLAEHLQNNVPIDQVIQRTEFENLDFIPCGRYPNQPGELLMSERFRETLRELKNKYDFVIFDSPPILATDDAASFATRTDAVLFVIRAGYTRLRQIRASLESLQRRGVPIYGIIVNFIDHREPGYYSYKYYDYYSYRTPAQNPS